MACAGTIMSPTAVHTLNKQGTLWAAVDLHLSLCRLLFLMMGCQHVLDLYLFLTMIALVGSLHVDLQGTTGTLHR